MKLKYFSMALAAVALASCTDDLNGGDNYTLATDGSQIFATIEADDLDDAAQTRAGFATQINKDKGTISQTAMFQEGDMFKMYCKDTWKPQVYKFSQDAKIDGVNGTVFDFAYTGDEPGAKYNDTNTTLATREYGVFPAESFAFADEYRSKLYFQLPAMNAYETNGNYYSSTTTDVEGLTTRKVYSALVPMFGFNVNNKIEFKYMTSLIRVQLQGVPEGTNTVKLTQGGGAKKQLSGVFESTKFDAAKGTESDLPVFNAVASTDPANQLISVIFEANGSQSDYIIYLPMPTGKYDLTNLVLTYTEPNTTDHVLPLNIASGDYKGADVTVDGGNASWAAAKKAAWNTAKVDFELGTGTKLLASYSGDENVSAGNLLKINSLLTKYANFDREANVNLTLTADIAIPAEDDAATVEKNKKLIVPALQNNVTLNITGGSFTTKPLIIEDAGAAGTGVLTINLNADGIASTQIINKSAQKIVLKTKDGSSAVFAGLVVNNEAADVTVQGKFSADITITKAAKFAIGTGFTSTGNVINNGAAELTLGAAATLTTDVASTLNITFAQATVTTAAATVNVKANITDLILTKAEAGKQTVNLTAGIITNLKGNGDTNKFKVGTVVEVNSSGSTAISTVADKVAPAAGQTAASLTFKSTLSKNAAAQAITGGKIYTAAQLLDIANANIATVDLLTSVEVASDFVASTWNPLSLNATTTTFNGNTIKKLPGALFAALTTDGLTINNVTLDGTNYTAKAGTVGALATSATAAGAVTLSNVIVKNATIGAVSGTAGSVSNDLGGIIGTSSAGTLNLNNCAVQSTTIQGYSNLGGFIGSVSEGNVNIVGGTNAAHTNVSSAITFKQSFTTNETPNALCGTVGNFIGSVKGTNQANITIGNDAVGNQVMIPTDFVNACKADLDFAKNTKGGKAFVGMTGYSVGHAIGYSPRPEGKTGAANGKFDLTIKGTGALGADQDGAKYTNVYAQ